MSRLSKWITFEKAFDLQTLPNLLSCSVFMVAFKAHLM